MTNFEKKRLSNNYQPPFKRSNTKDERAKQSRSNSKNTQSDGKRRQLSVSGTHHSSNFQPNYSAVNRPSRRTIANNKDQPRRFANNMPMHSNRKAKQNYYIQQFVDSDFYDTQSIQRTSVAPPQTGLKNRMRSTSPVSSQASTFLNKERSLNMRLSNLMDGEDKASNLKIN